MRAQESVLADLRERGWTLGTAESLTAGLVAAGVADVPGCSDVFRGGIVAYAADVKHRALGVSDEVLAQGIVSQSVAEAMAIGACAALRCDVAVSTTGVAGPGPLAGEPVGSVWIAVTSPLGTASRHLDLSGDRQAVRRQAVEACWSLLADEICGSGP